MRVLLVGASGLLGSAIGSALEADHDVVRASRTAEHSVDITDPDSIRALYDTVGPIDAVASAAGVTPFGRITELSVNDYRAGITDKLLGQIELARQGIERVTDGGSFTLISGILADDPIRTGTVASTVNGALNAFVRACAIELPRGLRINAVSPTVFREAWDSYGAFFPGYRPVPVADAAQAYVRSLDGAQTGRVYRVGY